MKIQDIPKIRRDTRLKKMLEIYDLINERYDELRDQGYLIRNSSRPDEPPLTDEERELRSLYQRRKRLLTRKSKAEWEEFRKQVKMWSGGITRPKWLLTREQLLDTTSDEAKKRGTELRQRLFDWDNRKAGIVAETRAESETGSDEQLEAQPDEESDEREDSEESGEREDSEDSEESEELTYYVAKVYSDGTIEPI
jgi:hypothetical protein